MRADGPVHIKDLFSRDHLLKNDTPLSERATLIAYFSKEIGRPAKFIAIRLAHYTLDDLYGLKSMYKDRLQRNERATADKFWWAITRTQKALSPVSTP